MSGKWDTSSISPIIIPYETPTNIVLYVIVSPLFKNSEKVHGSFFLAFLALFFKANAIKDMPATDSSEIAINKYPLVFLFI